MIPGQKGWTLAPNIPAKLAYKNRRTAGIDLAYWNVGGNMNPSEGLTKVGSPIVGASPIGVSTNFQNNVSNYYSTVWPTIADGSPYTLLTVVSVNSVSALKTIINADNATRCFQFRLNGATAEFIAFNTAVSTFTASLAGMQAGKQLVIIARNGGTGVAPSIFVNGIKGTDGSAITGTARGITATETQIGVRITSSWDGYIGMLVRWTRALSDADCRALTLNPYQLIQPIGTYTHLDTSGGGGGGGSVYNPYFYQHIAGIGA